MYDITFVGCGPASIFAVLRLLDSGYDGSIVMIDRGAWIERRRTNEYVSGWGGAGTFSDGKLTSSLDVGGNIPGLTQEELDKYSKYLLSKLSSFKKGPKLTWDDISIYPTEPSTLTWDVHKTCHMGTEITREIFKGIEDYIRSFSNVHIFMGTEVLDVDKLDNCYELKLSNSVKLKTKNVVLATGQKNNLPGNLIKKFDLHSTPRAFQLGIRVEDTMNADYEKIIAANYDFKFVKNYLFDDNVKVRVRTFCCNSGNAHVVDEHTSEGIVSFNGHAYKGLTEDNNSINYGIICEIENLDSCDSKEEQIEIVKKINSIGTWKEDNYTDGVIDSSKLLLDGFETLYGIYPNEAVMAIKLFVDELSKLIDLSKAHYYYPEVKLSGYVPKLNFNTFETELSGLYMIGDAAITRGIVKSTYSGDKMAREFINGN